MGIKETDKEKLKVFVGPPLDESFMKYYGFDKEGAREAIENYRIYYRAKGIFEAPLYENVKETLEQLKKSGKELYVATSKPEVFAKQILEHWEIDHLFVDIAGSNLDGSKINKDEVIASLLERNGIKDKSRILMVGDREHDVIGAKKQGLPSVGVLYGYGDYEELKNAGADYIIENITDLLKIVQERN
jgi:phosphoglycolate phosphatase